jgi:hypothetical protein
MNKPVAKPKKTRILNSKLLPIAALVLIVLALLFMATPLLRASGGFQRNGNFVNQNNGQTPPQNGFQVQIGGPQGQAGGSQGQALPGQNGSNLTNRPFAVRGGFLGGVTGAIVYFAALLVSLAAALGMVSTKRWGQVLGIIMAVLYGLVGLVSLLPILLLGSAGLRNPFSLILGIAHVLLALAVIVLASIPARLMATPAVTDQPPVTSS